jgi:hypothetical protein
MQKLGPRETISRQILKGSDKLVFRAAEKSVEFFDHLRAHYRETRRTTVDIPCEINVLLQDGTVFDTGSGVVRDVSPSGALITGLKLQKGCLPAQGFKITLHLQGADYAGIGIGATPVRFAADPPGLGLKFDEVFVTV